MENLGIGYSLQNGKYTIEKILGQGGFGITYLVGHQYLDSHYAIKEFFPQDYCMREGDTSSLSVITQTQTALVDQLRKRFLSEARNMAALNHPGIIKIHDVFEENGTAYFVMDFIDGDTLESLVTRKGPLPENEAVDLIIKVAEALEFIHKKKMAHYDVKPANIMLRRSDGQPILIDFGLSKQFNDNGDAKSKLLVGVSHGFSPLEQYYEGGITGFSPKTDIYALAATLYYLLTSRIPPEAPRLGGKLIEVPVNISKPVADTIKWAMNSDLTQRCPDINSFINGLRGNKTELAFNKPSRSSNHIAPPTPPKRPSVKKTSLSAPPDNHVSTQTASIPESNEKKKRLPVWLIVLLSAVGTIVILLVILACLPDKPESTVYPDEAEEMTDDAEMDEDYEEVIEIPANALDMTGTIGGKDIILWLQITVTGNTNNEVIGEYRYTSDPKNVYRVRGVQEPNGLIRWDAIDNSERAVERVRCYINSGQLDGQCYDLIDKSSITSIKAKVR